MTGDCGIFRLRKPPIDGVYIISRSGFGYPLYYLLGFRVVEVDGVEEGYRRVRMPGDP